MFNIDVERCRACCVTAKVGACIEDPVVIKKMLTQPEEKAPTTTVSSIRYNNDVPQSGIIAKNDITTGYCWLFPDYSVGYEVLGKCGFRVTGSVYTVRFGMSMFVLRYERLPSIC